MASDRDLPRTAERFVVGSPLRPPCSPRQDKLRFELAPEDSGILAHDLPPRTELAQVQKNALRLSWFQSGELGNSAPAARTLPDVSEFGIDVEPHVRPPLHENTRINRNQNTNELV